jgi:hypothetical protein
VKVAVELPAALHRDLLAYAEILAHQSGQPISDLRRLDDVYTKVSRVTWRKADVRPFVIGNSYKRNGVSR